MRHLLAIALVACSNKEPAKEQPKTEPPAHKPMVKNKLAKVTAKDPFAIEDVSFLPLGTMKGPIRGQYSVSWKSKGRKIGAHVRCRVHEKNLVKLFSHGSDDSAAFYPDPYEGDEPEACEVRWFVDDKKTEAILARACYHHSTLSDGPCPPELFPAPKLPDGMKIDFKTVPTPKGFSEPFPQLQMNQGLVQMSAIATVGERLKQKPFTRIRCQEGKTIGTGDVDAFVPIDLDRLEPGETIYGWEWTFHGDDKLKSIKNVERCDLEFLSGDPKKKPAPTSLGRFCLQPEDTKPGACKPPIGKTR